MPNYLGVKGISVQGGVFLSAIFLAACSSKSPTPLIEAQQAQRSAEALLERTEESVGSIGGHLEDVNEQLRKLKTERDELRGKVLEQSTAIQQLQQDLILAKSAKADAETQLADLREQKAKLEIELRQKQTAEKSPTQRSTE